MKALFDPNVRNALQTSPSVHRFLQTLKSQSNTSAGDIDVMCHSLGNLAGMDALRIHRKKSADPLIDDMIMVESATWGETYWQEGEYIYSAAAGNTTEYPITYSYDQLKQQSWCSWFNEDSYKIKDIIAGQLYNSYNPTDEALYKWMRYNDHYWRSSWQLRQWSFYRDRLYQSPPTYRAPETTDTKASLVYRCPAMMKMRKHPGSDNFGYDWRELSLPAGAREIAMADDNLNAFAEWDDAWRKEKHSDFLVQPYFLIYPWYEYFAAAVPIGIE